MSRIGRPATISRDDVVSAGCAIGLADLSVAAVAQRLGVTPTSVHRHAGSRAELETLVGERLVVTMPMPHDHGQPLAEYLLDFARGLVAHMLAHPGLAAYFNRGFPRTTASARVVEDFDATLVARGLTAAQAVRLAISVANLAISAAAFRQFDDGSKRLTLDVVEFPVQAEVHAAGMDGEEWFDWSIRAAVAGLAERAADPC